MVIFEKKSLLLRNAPPHKYQMAAPLSGTSQLHPDLADVSDNKQQEQTDVNRTVLHQNTTSKLPEQPVIYSQVNKYRKK